MTKNKQRNKKRINIGILHLPRAVNKLKKYRFRAVRYSPSTALIAEHLTEALTVTSFPGQPILKCKISDYLKVCYYFKKTNYFKYFFKILILNQKL